MLNNVALCDIVGEMDGVIVAEAEGVNVLVGSCVGLCIDVFVGVGGLVNVGTTVSEAVASLVGVRLPVLIPDPVDDALTLSDNDLDADMVFFKVTSSLRVREKLAPWVSEEVAECPTDRVEDLLTVQDKVRVGEIVVVCAFVKENMPFVMESLLD